MPEPPTHDLTEEAFERWIASFRGPLVGLLASWGSDWRAAEELAQDVFAEAWIGRARFRGSPDDLPAAGAWLRGIAFHLHAGALRRGRPTERLDEDRAAPEDEPEDERRALLAKAFARLSGPQRTVLRMAYLESAGVREVAALLGISPKAAEGRLYHARRALRAKVEHVARETAQEVRR